MEGINAFRGTAQASATGGAGGVQGQQDGNNQNAQGGPNAQDQAALASVFGKLNVQ